MNKMLQNYGKARAISQSPTQLVGTLFHKCAHYLNLMENNIQEKSYYERFLNSEKASAILTNLMASLDETSPETRDFSEEVKQFCYLMLSYITEINQKERVDLCQKTSYLLREMGNVWEGV